MFTVGVFHVDTNQDAHIKEIEKSLPETRLGGSWKPPSCVSREKLAVVIPYRARWQHLQLLLKYLHPMLQRQQRDYTIFIVEQVCLPLSKIKSSILFITEVTSTQSIH